LTRSDDRFDTRFLVWVGVDAPPPILPEVGLYYQFVETYATRFFDKIMQLEQGLLGQFATEAPSQYTLGFDVAFDRNDLFAVAPEDGIPKKKD
jgi:hypothetical protein